MMNMLKVVVVLALVAGFVGIGQAATIALVSDAYAPGEGAVDPLNPTVNHEDDVFVSYLQGLGYTVDTAGMGKAYVEGNDPFAAGSASLAALQSADLVIVSRRTGSGSYDNDRKEWNELETPLLLMSGYLTRGETSSKKWGWTTGGSGDSKDENGLSTLTDLAIIGAHPFMPIPEIFDWSSNGGVAPKGVYLPNSSVEVVAGGIVVAEYGDDRPFIIDFAAGTDFDAGNGDGDKYGIAGERRAFFGHWGYDTVGYDFSSFTTGDYDALLGQTIATLVPEPATLALLGLGGILLRRRRR